MKNNANRYKIIFKIGSICIISFFLETLCLGQAKVVKEQGCKIKIEGQVFEKGDEVVIKKEVKGQLKKIAIARITKSKREKSLAKVFSGKSKCGSLKGLEVSLDSKSGDSESGSGSGSKSESSSSSASKTSLDLSKQKLILEGELAIVNLSLVGMHQQLEEKVKTLSLIGYGAGIEVYPLAYSATGVFQNGLGIAFNGETARAIPDIEVASPSGDPSENAKQQTVPSLLQVGLGFRFFSLLGKLESSAWILPLWQHSLQSVLTKTTVLTRSPMRNTAYTGFGIGIREVYQINSAILVRASLKYGLGMGGSADVATAEDSEIISDKIKDASAILLDLMGNYKITQKTAIGGGIKLHTYSGGITLTNEQAIKISEQYTILYLSISTRL